MGLSVSCIVLRGYPTFFASPALSSGFLRLEGPKHLPINSSARSWLRHCTLSPFPLSGTNTQTLTTNCKTSSTICLLRDSFEIVRLVEPETLKAISGFPPFEATEQSVCSPSVIVSLDNVCSCCCCSCIFVLYLLASPHRGFELCSQWESCRGEGNQDIRSSIIWMKGTHR